jgi:hypothetical protein
LRLKASNWRVRVAARSAACWMDWTFVHGAALFQLVEQHLGVSVDDHQQVVEVVGDAAGETANGIHFLRLAKLLFELTAVGNIFGDQLQHFFRFIAEPWRRSH